MELWGNPLHPVVRDPSIVNITILNFSFGNTDAEILDAVKLGEYTFDIPEFEGVSEHAKDLIKKMICPVKNRLTAEKILENAWLKSDLKNNK